MTPEHATALRSAARRANRSGGRHAADVAARDALIRELAGTGTSLSQIGREVGLSTARIAQIVNADKEAPRP